MMDQAEAATELPGREPSAAEIAAAAMFEGDLACQAIGARIEQVSAGFARLRMRLTERMVNLHGTAHGGYLFLLADAAFAYACNSHGPAAVAQGAQITFLGPAVPGDELFAEAVERGRQGRVGIYDVTVRHTDGRVIAEFRGQSMTLSGRRSSTASPVDGGPDA
jgi:acyl-CoA thioesterase